MPTARPDRFLHNERSRRPEIAIPRTVIAAVAPEDHDDVLRIAWVRASTLGMRLVVCTVVQDSAEVASAYEALQHRTRSIMPKGAEPELDVRVGDRAEKVLECCEMHRTELLVMGPGSHREGILARFFSPSLPTAVMRKATFPILVPRYSPATGRILAAIELGEPMKPVLTAAAEELRRCGGQIFVVHCVAPMPVVASMEFPVPPPTAEIASAAQSEVERAMLENGLTDGQMRIEMGPPASTILELARDLAVDLILLGTHGRSGPARLLLGSVAEEVLRDATCNVMVVRAGT